MRHEVVVVRSLKTKAEAAAWLAAAWVVIARHKLPRPGLQVDVGSEITVTLSLHGSPQRVALVADALGEIRTT